MNNFAFPERNREVPIAVLERARELADGANAQGMSMQFDAAQGYVEILEEANRLPLLPLHEGEASISTMEPSEVYKLAEALDVAMTFDPDESRRWAAASLVVEIHDTLVHLTAKGAGARATIMSAVLGVATDAESTVPEQLVEHYFSGEQGEQRFILAAIQERVRTAVNRT